MPFAVYSKRTNVVTRIVHNLATLLPSEAIIELDEDNAFPRRYPATLIGQNINTLGIRQFDIGAGEPATNPLDEAGVAREPILTEIPDPARVEMPLHAVPSNWDADDLRRAKYEAILAKNRPYHVVVGEEFQNTTHIDTVESSLYVLANNKGIILPGGDITTVEFQFRIPLTDQGGNPADRDEYDLFQFDTVYLKVTPKQDLGLTIEMDTRKISDSLLDGFSAINVNDQTALANKKEGIILRFTNNSSHPVALENYMLFVQLRNI